jgi:hypothetical protein
VEKKERVTETGKARLLEKLRGIRFKDREFEDTVSVE